MITINLLAPGKRRPTRLAPTGILPILGIGAVVFVLVMFSIYLSDRAASTRAQLNAVNKQLEALGPVTQQVQKLEQTIATLKARQGQLNQLLAMQLPASLSLEALTLTLLVVNAYAAAVVGRLRSLPLTFAGALALGLAQSYAVGYLPLRGVLTALSTS